MELKHINSNGEIDIVGHLNCANFFWGEILNILIKKRFQLVIFEEDALTIGKQDSS